ncbi:MAG: hypothetical protein ACE5KZ_15450 [Candidatus Scalinduaceae bacterium]
MSENENQMTKVDEKYEPSVKLKKYVAVLLSPETKGCKTEAERLTGVDRRTFYKQYKYNEKFRKWYNSEIQAFSETLAAKAMCALSDMMESKDDPYARIQAIRTWAEMMGRIRVNNINVDQSRHMHVTFLDLAKRARLEGDNGGG